MSFLTPLALLVATLQPTLPTDAPQFEVHLYADRATVQPGGAAELVVELKIAEKWRLYHPLVLDVGRPLSISFNVPAGAAVGPLRFPRPLLGAQGEQEYLAFEERLLVLTRLTLTPDLTTTPLEITARVQGQASRGNQHVPIAGEATLSLAVSDEPGAPANQDLFAEVRDALPQPLAEADYLAGSRLLVSHTQIPLGEQASVVAVIRVKPGHHIQDRNPGVEGLIASRLFIESPPGLEFGQQIWPQPKLRDMQFFGKVREQSGDVVIQMPFTLAAEELTPGPVRLAVLFEYQTCSDAGVCFAPNMAAGSVEFTVLPAGTPAVKNDDPLIAKLATNVRPTPDASGESTDGDSKRTTPNLLLVFLGAFVGGAILNIMPCVLPVISLKIFGFMQQAGDDRRRVFRMGLVYTAGILASFAVLAVAMVAGLAWGGLMQRPAFLIGLSAVVFAFALSLLGVFEVQLPGAAANAAGQAASREGYGGAFLNGVLATLLATPCMAPLLGAAVGVLTQSPWWVAGPGIMVVGLGLAAPYLLLTAFPAWLRFLPKPGPWMVTFKEIMGFVLILVVLWLLSILVALVDIGQILATLGLLCTVGIGCWLLGKIRLNALPRQTATIWIAALLVLVGGGWSSFRLFSPGKSELPWQAWQPGLAEQLAEQGYTVYVDYTADWCLTCKWNKAWVLETSRTASEFKRLGVYPIKADFTSRNRLMHQELRGHGRNGVPLNIVIPAGKPTEPIVLPEVLTRKVVLNSLQAAGSSRQMPGFWSEKP